jgi:hypothetical protein
MQISWVIFLFFFLFFTHVLFVCSIFMFAHVIVFFFQKKLVLFVLMRLSFSLRDLSGALTGSAQRNWKVGDSNMEEESEAKEKQEMGQ